MFRTHTAIKGNKTCNSWFVVNSFTKSFNESIVQPRQLLQSTKTNSKLKAINKVEKNDARRVSQSREEVINNRYDLRKLYLGK